MAIFDASSASSERKGILSLSERKPSEQEHIRHILLLPFLFSFSLTQANEWGKEEMEGDKDVHKHPKGLTGARDKVFANSGTAAAASGPSPARPPPSSLSVEFLRWRRHQANTVVVHDHAPAAALAAFCPILLTPDFSFPQWN
jgi:hypothetical protein